MATVKIILRPEKKRDGTHALSIRITKDRKSSFIYLDFSIRAEDWDAEKQRVKKSNLNHARLNNYLLQKVAEANDTALELQTSKSHVSARAVKEKVQPKTGATFNPIADLYLENLKRAGKYNRYTADKPRIKHFKEFLKGDDIAFADITVGMLERFRVFVKEKYNVSERTIINHFVVMRSVFSLAIKEGVCKQEFYPFGKGKIIIKFPESTKVGIGKEDVKKLEEIELTHQPYDHARNLWLISYYFAGMRISDVLRLRWSDFQDMRLHYTMGKNKKAGSLKTPERALAILDKYEQFKENANDLIFPDLKVLSNLDDDFEVQRKIAFATSRYDKFLREHVAPTAGINKKLTMHIARHTFATNAGDLIPIQMLQKLYRHSNIATTIGYQANFINKDADDALDAVLSM